MRASPANKAANEDGSDRSWARGPWKESFATLASNLRTSLASPVACGLRSLAGMLRRTVLLVILLVLQAGDASADYPFCNADGACAWPETCGTCPMECGSCDVTARTNQRAKYVDRACAEHGDGLADSCAAGPGQAGRFNDLQLAIESLVAGDTLYIHPGD